MPVRIKAAVIMHGESTGETPIWYTDAARYRSPEFLVRERTAVFERTWLVAAAAGPLQARGSYRAVDMLGRSVAIVRGDDGRVRAFHNVCLHRGTRLLDGHGRTDCIRCPYHGWRYELNGRLCDIPQRRGFRMPAASEPLQLHEIAAAEALGLIWICFAADPPDFAAWLGGIPAETAAYRLDEMRPIQERTWDLQCNWKAVIENAIESYHIAAVHARSVQSNVRETPDFHADGDHVRQTLAIAPFAWRRVVDRVTSRGGPYTRRQRDALQKYLLFPNTVVNVIPCHLTIFQTWPVAPDRCRFFYGFYGRRGALPPEWLRARASWLFSRWVLREDMRILSRFQQGAADECVRRHWFHENEIAVAHLHAALTRWMETDDSD